MEKVIAIIGAGAAGFFTAINAAIHNKDAEIFILEASDKLLSKVKISGGGRCNVTHACFDPKELCKFYPRGAKALLGAFHQFQVKDTIQWFEKRGVKLKTEEDGRMFPVSNSSQTIIDCFLSEANKLGIKIRFKHKLSALERHDDGTFQLKFMSQDTITANKVVFCTGSSNTAWDIIQSLGIKCIPPVPSLFTFNTKNTLFRDLAGIAINVKIHIDGYKQLKSEGPLLITHQGISGPAVLKLSSWGAKELSYLEYKFIVVVNWVGKNFEEILSELMSNNSSKQIQNLNLFDLPNRLWRNLLIETGIELDKNLHEIAKKQKIKLTEQLYQCKIPIHGKSTFKEEFVSCGGVALDEINFKTMESKAINGLFFAGEVLDIDAITGGFNFQAAWTTAWITAQQL